MAFVLDASVCAIWALSDEIHPLADVTIEHLEQENALVPPLWWFEIRNVLMISERRKRLTVEASDAFLKQLEEWQSLSSSWPMSVDGCRSRRMRRPRRRSCAIALCRPATMSFRSRRGAGWGRKKKVKLEPFLIFNQQFLTLVRAGLPILARWRCWPRTRRIPTLPGSWNVTAREDGRIALGPLRRRADFR
jgi:hypothetical protein